MSETPVEELPDAVNGSGGESDVIAERSGAGTPVAPRPVPADLVDPPWVVVEEPAQPEPASADEPPQAEAEQAEAEQAEPEQAEGAVDRDEPEGEETGEVEKPDVGPVS